MPAKRPDCAAAHLTSMIQAPPLGEADLRFVRDALADIAPDWCAELEGICADMATIVIVPEDGEDASGPSFVISRDGFGFRLDQVHWDDMQEVGVFSSLADIINAVQQRMTMDYSRLHGASLTLH